MRDVCLRFSINRGPCQRSHLSLVFCECLQVIIHKGDTDLAYKISPMYRESQCAPATCAVIAPLQVWMARSLQRFSEEAVSGAPACRLRGTKVAQWLRVATGTRNPPRGHTSYQDLLDRQYGSRHRP